MLCSNIKIDTTHKTVCVCVWPLLIVKITTSVPCFFVDYREDLPSLLADIYQDTKQNTGLVDSITGE